MGTIAQKDLYRLISEAEARGEQFAVATVTRTRGSTPQQRGAKMIFFESGRAEGTVGGGCIEAEVWAEAKEALRTKQPALHHFSLTAEEASEEGMVCGGTMDIFIDVSNGVKGKGKRGSNFPLPVTHSPFRLDQPMAESFIENYRAKHKHPLNKLTHSIGIPMIVISLPLFFFNWRWALALFIVGWILQFVGHAIEGNQPAFFKNPVYLLVGPLWLLRRAAAAIGIAKPTPTK